MHFMCKISFNIHNDPELDTKQYSYLQSEFKSRPEFKNCSSET